MEIIEVAGKLFFTTLVIGIGDWLNCADVSSRGYMLGYSDLKDKSVSRLFRLLSKVGDGLMKMRIVKMEFHE